MEDTLRPSSAPDELTQLRALLAQRESTIAQHHATIAQHHATIAQHHATIAQQQSTISTLTAQRDEYYLEKLRLEVRLAKALKQAYGPRADRVGNIAQLLLDFARQWEALPPEPQDASPAADEGRTADRPAPRRLRTRGRRDIGTLNHLPLIEKTYELTGDLCLCPTCRGEREKIGTEVTYTIEHIPASLLRIKHIQFKYACRACDRQGHSPHIELAGKKNASPIDKGLPGPGLLAYLATAKYADFLPLHRLENIFARHGFDLDRSTMCLWMADVARLVRPVYDRMAHLVRQSHVLATDDTVMPLLQPGRAKQARMWIYLGDESQPYNVFDFTPTRSRDGPAHFLQEFGGTLLADAYGGYDGIVLDRELPRAGCWSHARRKFVEADPTAPDVARAVLRLIKGLFEVERRAVDCATEDRLRLREAESKPLLETLHTLLLEQKALLLPKHPMAQAIGYALNQWTELTLFTADGAVPIHNNLAEQQMKRIALLRKNALFVATPNGGRTAAILSSLTSTCRRHEINPQGYLTQLLTNLPDTPVNEIDRWLPDQWKQTRAATAAD
jgi:transposase